MKIALFELILRKFESQRRIYDELMTDKSKIDDALKIGSEKARLVAKNVLNRVREKIGFKV